MITLRPGLLENELNTHTDTQDTPPGRLCMGEQQGGFASIYNVTRKQSECGQSEIKSEGKIGSELSHADRSVDFIKTCC